MFLKLLLIAIIVGAAAVFLWFTLSFLFRPTGKFFYRLFKEAKDAINGETEQDNNLANEKEK